MGFTFLAISFKTLHLVFLDIGTTPAFAKMEALVPFGSLMICLRIFRISRGVMLLLVPLSFLGAVLGFSTKETKVLLSLPSSLANPEVLVLLQGQLQPFAFQLQSNVDFWAFSQTCNKARNSENS
jgi:hypothetical protein